MREHFSCFFFRFENVFPFKDDSSHQAGKEAVATNQEVVVDVSQENF